MLFLCIIFRFLIFRFKFIFKCKLLFVKNCIFFLLALSLDKLRNILVFIFSVISLKSMFILLYLLQLELCLILVFNFSLSLSESPPPLFFSSVDLFSSSSKIVLLVKKYCLYLFFVISLFNLIFFILSSNLFS